jgi:hypothetical protein
MNPRMLLTIFFNFTHILDRREIVGSSDSVTGLGGAAGIAIASIEADLDSCGVLGNE